MRAFFAARGVLEVDTPILGAATATDPHLASLSSRVSAVGGQAERTMYLQTSPELAMKRLLAAGSGPIYQICKCFRDGEAGRLHNPEFTMLEWYRPGFDHQRLMDEVDELVQTVLCRPAGERLSYREALGRVTGLDPLTAPTAALTERARALIAAPPALSEDDRDGWLDLILTHLVEPGLGRGRPTFVVDFPASQAALARIRPDQPPVAERFELWVDGVELANGYHELSDAGEQRRRCESHLAARGRLGLPAVPVDERTLAALEHGLPACAGVALGFDRLVLLAVGAASLAEILAFPIDRA